MIGTLLASSALAICAGKAQATNYTLNLSGDPANFTQYSIPAFGYIFDVHYLTLTGLDPDNAITVSQGDTIDSTVTLTSAYTIPQSVVRTDILQYLTGSAFPLDGTGVDGTFIFYLGGTAVNTFSYSSSTSGQLASFAAVFPPNNGAFTFDSFTNDFTINTLPNPATLDGSAFAYALVSNAVPEPSTWAMMLAGFAGLGFVGYRRNKAATLAA
ncbi:PEP-CTERM sorting domain-containing protein [uncultured Rhodoblastus sp.]|uniref:PEP-CTERM sorting domain-containing protein n=1 Tax=uncultured Rhodoblastus sp. TaxID=543037 RepID=UPI0025CEBCCD|nr:PEP-CTERM sorting domain-containing protein [uncultured Rhodoblastus sp.]